MVPAPPAAPEIVIVPSSAPKQVIFVPAAEPVRTGGWVRVILAVAVHPFVSRTAHCIITCFQSTDIFCWCCE